MELQFLPLPLSFPSLLLLFLFLLMVWKNLSQIDNLARNLPTAPIMLPLIGNLHNLIGGAPHYVLRDLAEKYGPIMHLQLGEVSTVVVSSAEMAKEVLVTHDPSFADRPPRLATTILCYDLQDLAFTPYGDHWRQMRKICLMELLSGKRVRSFSFIRYGEITKLMESIRFSSGKAVNITHKFFVYTSSMTCRAAFGGILKNNEMMIEFLKKSVTLAGGFVAADFFPSLKILPIISGMKGELLTMHHKINAILDDVINQHKVKHESGKKGNVESGDEDLIDILLRQQENDVFNTGTDTSSIVTEWAMSELMKNPKVMAKVQAEVRQVCKGKKTIEEEDIQKLTYLKMVVKETLRLHPPVPLIPRSNKENRDVKGYMIPQKSQILVNVWAMGRNPIYWDDPESFKPERFEQKSVEYTGYQFEYIPFGTGKRMCPAITFGLVNIELPLAHLLYHFDWGLPDGMKVDDLDMDESIGITVGRKNDLFLVATACYPSWNE